MKYPGKKHQLFTSAPDRAIRLLTAAHGVWILFVFLLVLWWGRLVLRQAQQITELRFAVGMAEKEAWSYWDKTQRMLYWEGGSFLILLLASTGVLFWIYWRDFKRAKGIQAFFASVTHELRTPLTSIRLQAESLAESVGGKTPEKDLVGRLLEDTLRLENQVERTLELARVEGGGQVYLQTLQLKPWIERFLKNWSHYQKDDVRFAVELDVRIEDCWVEADPVALHVIFKNLLENSIKHATHPSTEKLRIRVISERLGSTVRLAIEDNGQERAQSMVQNHKSHPSQPEGALQTDRLGEIFYRGAGSSGTGVGLYLVRALMKKMGGSVRFSFESGFKTQMIFREGVAHE